MASRERGPLMCSVGYFEYYAGENWFQDLQRARVARACAECSLPIPAGEKHWRYLMGDGEYEDPWRRHFEHRECAKLARFAADAVCGSDEYATGELEEHLVYCADALRLDAIRDDEAAVDAFEPDGENFYDYEIDLDKARRALLWAAAIEQRYDGVERDVGGEGG